MKGLEEEMERLRRMMQQQAVELGLNHPDVIRISQQLDELHNQWNRWQNPSAQSQAPHQAAYIIKRYTSRIKEAALGRSEFGSRGGLFVQLSRDGRECRELSCITFCFPV